MAEKVGLVSAILGISAQIVRLAGTAQRNWAKCNLLRERVEDIILLMTELNRQWTPDPVTKSMLGNLDAALNDGKALVEACQQKRTWSRIFRTQKKANKFDALDIRISKILEQFHVANMILIGSINKECFFINVLEKLLRHGACRNLPQSVKEELKSDIKGLSNTDNMSPDAKRVLELLINELTFGDTASESSSVRPGGRGGKEASADDDALTTDIVSLVVDIVEKAQNPRQNRDEIQQLAKFVQLLANLMEGSSYSDLLQHPNMRPLMNRLKDDLKQACMIIRDNCSDDQASKIRRVILCGVDGANSSQKPEEILKVAYRIEYYVHVLPVSCLRGSSNRFFSKI